MKTYLYLRIMAGIVIAMTVVSVSAQTKSNSESNVHGVPYRPLNVKTGLWESTVTIKRSGGLPLSSEMLEKMTPEQRARLQARMDATSEHTSTTTDKQCITKEDLERPIDFGKNECSWTILESTSTRARGNVSCETSGITLNGTGTYEALDSEHMRGSQHLVSSGGGNTMVVDGSVTSKWVGATCDKRARE